ncbi:unnamed protein product [Fraxinus pennsylvanica]|uniref:Myb/SANT-like DNA-binding domain-containing protein n=1 Tax=Fraxinus pennsylvanica TaxID=56036 RepID=A0AAD2DTF9_9LAMI|nr:unnamed protein product [Fraxinus pennsylvanica]
MGNCIIMRNPRGTPRKESWSLSSQTMSLSLKGGMWSEEESFVFFEVWGERNTKLGRRNLRTEDWVEVAEKVLEMSGVEKTEMECRSQLNELKNKYKKEKVKVESGQASKWLDRSNLVDEMRDDPG